MTVPKVRRALGSRKLDYSASECLSAAQSKVLQSHWEYGTPHPEHRKTPATWLWGGMPAVSTYSPRSGWERLTTTPLNQETPTVRARDSGGRELVAEHCSQGGSSQR